MSKLDAEILCSKSDIFMYPPSCQRSRACVRAVSIFLSTTCIGAQVQRNRWEFIPEILSVQLSFKYRFLGMLFKIGLRHRLCQLRFKPCHKKGYFLTGLKIEKEIPISQACIGDTYLSVCGHACLRPVPRSYFSCIFGLYFWPVSGNEQSVCRTSNLKHKQA